MNLINFDFSDCVKYICDTYRDCESYGCDYICRCSKIRNCKIISVNVNKISNSIIKSYYDNTVSAKRNNLINNILGNITKEVNLYTIDKILRINSVYNSEVWNIKISKGYYGEEIESISIIKSLSDKIDDQLDTAFSIVDLTKRIEYLLLLEYGYILPELKDCKYKIATINTDDIIFGSDYQYDKISKENLNYYNDVNYNLFRGIVIPKADKYRLIDGYHRCYATKLKKIEIIKAIK